MFETKNEERVIVSTFKRQRYLIEKGCQSKTSMHRQIWMNKSIRQPQNTMWFIQFHVAFADVVNYKIFWLRNRSQKYNWKIKARTAKLAKRMETIMKPYKFEDSGPVTILSFLE